ncbi:MAG: hypothetical protein K2X27_24240 [Candidatus Obscuribacterales bacterium]|nr:hypothetical protein [Candidatus Obscuribacterales bacterium]
MSARKQSFLLAPLLLSIALINGYSEKHPPSVKPEVKPPSLEAERIVPESAAAQAESAEPTMKHKESPENILSRETNAPKSTETVPLNMELQDSNKLEQNESMQAESEESENTEHNNDDSESVESNNEQLKEIFELMKNKEYRKADLQLRELESSAIGQKDERRMSILSELRSDLDAINF